MAQQFSYADDSPIRVGDWVRLEFGSAKGRVNEIVNTPQLAAEKKLGGLGVVVDAQPKGFVFLSEACLQEDPLQLVRRGPCEQTRFVAAFALSLGLLLMLPAVYSFFSALYSALSTGEVLVIAVYRYEIHREIVPWTTGWARFAGPPLLVASLLAFDGSRGVTLRWWLAAAGSVAALTLLGYSLVFTSIDRALLCIAIFAFAMLAHKIDKRFGRAAALALMVACVGVILWAAFGNA